MEIKIGEVCHEMDRGDQGMNIDESPQRSEETHHVIANAADLRELFEPSVSKNFEHYQPLKDRDAGFSVQRNYPENTDLPVPRTKNGKADRVCVIHVSCLRPNAHSRDESETRIPIYMRAFLHNKYISMHSDYNFDDEDCPTPESLNAAKGGKRPLELVVHNEYFFSSRFQRLVNASGDIVSGSDLLDGLYNNHVNTATTVRGAVLRAKLRTQEKALDTLSVLISGCKWVLTNPLGRTLEASDRDDPYFNGYKRGSLKKTSVDSLAIFGYKASKFSVVALAAFTMSIYFFRSMLPTAIREPLSGLARTTFASTMASILFISAIDEIVPMLVFRLLNRLIKWRFGLLFRKFKF